jgi:hypothetical protein
LAATGANWTAPTIELPELADPDGAATALDY